MPSAMDLFGESSDDDDDDEPTQSRPAEEQSKKPSSGNDTDNKNNDDEEEDEGAEFDGAVVGLSSKTMAGAKLSDTQDMETEDTTAAAPRKAPPKIVHQPDLKIPSTTSLPPDVSVHVTKLPNLMGIQAQPFDTATYLPSAEDQEFGSMAASLVRWRYADKTDKSEDAQIESNTRFVEWEDGSWTLHIGTEAFEVDFKDNSKKDFPGFNGYLFQSHQAEMEQPEEAPTVLECVAPVASRLTVHPSSLQSAAHKSLTVAVRQKTLKQARIATLATQDDPELQKAERIRASQDVHKQQRKSGGGRVGLGGGRRRPRMSRGYLEDDFDDDAYDTTNLRGMKRKFREGDDLDDFIDDEEEEEDMGRSFRSKRGRRQKQEPEDDDDEEEEELVLGGDDDDDEEDEAAPRLKKKDKKPAHRNVFDEDDDDDDDDE